ncbi:hypothetical protein AK833_12890 [Lysinibacillus sp. F5]|nr:hypothetical protein AK833_12890 [Lysinibacillus sp. F5]
MYNMIECPCQSCGSISSLKYMERVDLNREDVVLCSECYRHFKGYGYTPESLNKSYKLIYCDKCNRPHTKVDIYKIGKNNLCLICEQIVKKNGKLEKNIKSDEKEIDKHNPNTESSFGFKHLISYIVLIIWVIWMVSGILR